MRVYLSDLYYFDTAQGRQRRTTSRPGRYLNTGGDRRRTEGRVYFHNTARPGVDGRTWVRCGTTHLDEIDGAPVTAISTLPPPLPLSRPVRSPRTAPASPPPPSPTSNKLMDLVGSRARPRHAAPAITSCSVQPRITRIWHRSVTMRGRAIVSTGAA